jgi:hypothetical protein
VAAWLFVALGTPAGAESPATERAAWGELRSQSASVSSHIFSANDQRLEVFRQAPTLSGHLRVSEQTVIPFVGAGFGGGYVTERDRALGPSQAFPQQNLLGDSLGKGMMPNEWQMGIRIPF